MSKVLYRILESIVCVMGIRDYNRRWLSDGTGGYHNL